MSDEEILEKLRKLPVQKKIQIEKIIEDALTSIREKPLKRQAGFAKRLIKILPGFDDPIEGMEDYYK